MPITVDTKAVIASSASFPKPATFTPTYGTAGFRAEASLLESTLFRCGLLAAARALITRRACGLMITASHNPARDNGVKLVEPGGEMLPQSWESLATELAQCETDDSVANKINDILRHATGGDGHEPSAPPAACRTDDLAPPTGAEAANAPVVIIGYDTRESALKLLRAAKAGVEAMGVPVDVAGQVTTPQLHWVVHAHNTRQGHPSAADCLPRYFDVLLGAFEEFVGDLPPAPHGQPLYVDCANGVGACQVEAARERLEKSGLRLVLQNTGAGGLNTGCGADYVQKERVAPQGMEGLLPGSRCCSIDGDADRVVFFTPSGAPQVPAAGGPAAAAAAAGAAPPPLEGPPAIALLDGDKIATLAACTVCDLIAQLPPSFSSSSGAGARPRVGVVQTAYANGASTSYIVNTLRLPVECTATGVKHLHHAALQYDVGIYWEANGHGTVLLSPVFCAALESVKGESAAARQLLLLSRMVNQTVGDALSGVLLVEGVLRKKQWDLDVWNRLYTDFPSRQSKLTVKDRNVITTTDAERKCVAPEGLQAAIDQAVAKYPEGSRAFVRPSGTEDAVRVYAEAPTQEQADALALDVCRIVYDKAGGVGARP